jgi:NAD(P)-dependent dehydrogenase (short-subunit alcohol dehydrogenase family)
MGQLTNEISEKEPETAVIITGASRGIGQALAIAFALEHQVYACARSEADLRKLAQAQERIHPVLLDLSSHSSITTAQAYIFQHIKKNDYKLVGLINNAAIFQPSPEDQPMAVWQKTFQTNLFGTIEWTRGFVEALTQAARDRSSRQNPSCNPRDTSSHNSAQNLGSHTTQSSWIINISSTAALKPIPYYSAYGASKAALNYWSQCLALELAPWVRVNTISPGVVDTPIHGFHHLPPAEKEKVLIEWANKHPMGRVGTVQDIVEACLFLSSHQTSPWITGSDLRVDGGISLT